MPFGRPIITFDPDYVPPVIPEPVSVPLFVETREPLVPVLGPDGLPLRLFGNAIVRKPTRDDVFCIIDRHGDEHWIEVGYT